MSHSPSVLMNFMREYNFRPRKRWGQNFLIDKNIQKKIIKSAHINENDTVLEIGPGFGALTEILSQTAKRVIAVERDKNLVGILQNNLAKHKNLEIICADILKFDINKLGTRLKVIGNLPYCIATPIVIQIIKSRSIIDSATVALQKEVAERLISKPDKAVYGAISCFVQFYSRPSLIMKIKKNAFYPQPEIESSIIRLEMRKTPKVNVKNEEFFLKIIRSSFNQRRKNLLNSLTNGLKIDKQFLQNTLECAGVNYKRRGESLSLEEFAKIANNISNSSFTPQRRGVSDK